MVFLCGNLPWQSIPIIVEFVDLSTIFESFTALFSFFVRVLAVFACFSLGCSFIFSSVSCVFSRLFSYFRKRYSCKKKQKRAGDYACPFWDARGDPRGFYRLASLQLDSVTIRLHYSMGENRLRIELVMKATLPILKFARVTSCETFRVSSKSVLISRTQGTPSSTAPHS